MEGTGICEVALCEARSNGTGKVGKRWLAVNARYAFKNVATL